MRSRNYIGAAALALFSLNGCVVAIPEPIYVNQIRAAFPDPSATDTEEQQAQHRRHVEAEVCAGRLNRHRNQAQIISGFQITFTALGGLSSGVGGIVAALPESDEDTETAMAITAAIGGGVALLANFLVAVLGNPDTLLRQHSDGAQSWYRAVGLARDAASQDELVLRHLSNCQRDVAPQDPTSPAGQGAAAPAL